MARKRQSKHKHSTRKERNEWKPSQDVTSISQDQKEFSEKLSSVLDYFAFNTELMEFRRKDMLYLEREQTLLLQAHGYNRRMYMFGSQIEGTTTCRMKSDVDTLQRLDTFHLFLDSENPPLLPYCHKVLIKVSTNGCASQYCV